MITCLRRCGGVRVRRFTHTEGGVEEAVELAREAVLIARPTSDPNTIADGLVDLAEILFQAHILRRAAAAAAEALEHYEAKGNLVGAARAPGAHPDR